MATTTIDLLAPVHRLSVEEYRRMGEIGMFDESAVRVELIAGVIVEMSPMGPRHRRAVSWLTRALVPQLGDEHILSPQNHVVLTALASAPEPDIAIFALAELDRAEERPLLIVEVSDSSLRFDRITKARLYARQGIPEYWIFNVGEQVMEVHREPSGGAWASRTVHGAGETLRPVALPDVAVELSPLFAFMAVLD